MAKEYLDKIQEMFNQYENDEYMSKRLNTHIMTILPATLETEAKTREKRITRTHFLTNEQTVFVQVFLSKYKYFYLQNNGCFYKYNGKNYGPVKVDDIQNQLLATISKDGVLMDWKYKTIDVVIKQIKERNILKSVPESNTIQSVLKLFCPAIFSDKIEAKYFLTILGDNIFKDKEKEKTDLVFFVKPKSKKLINEIQNIAYIMIGMPNITHNFVSKYHENYKYENCRVLKMKDSISIDVWKSILKKYGLDILCVASHYSNRYGSSESFLHNKHGDFVSYTLYLKENSVGEIMERFCKESIETVNAVENEVSSKVSMNWKNIHYIWKQYLSRHSLPSMIYVNQLKLLLKQRFTYNEDTETFDNVTSKYLPVVCDFIQFWEKAISNSVEADFVDELEIDEICDLFKRWVNTSDKHAVQSSGILCEGDVLKILKHFFNSVEIVENKYVMGVVSLVWNKKEDIVASIDFYRGSNIIYQEDITLISFDTLYENYCTFCCNKNNKKTTKLIVSKIYFEKYMSFTYSDIIKFESFIPITWNA